MSNPLDDPTCHDCLIAQSLRATIEDLYAEIDVLKGTKAMPGVQRVSHGDTDDPPPSTR